MATPAHWTRSGRAEASRRARGLPIYAALRSLGRTGLAELIDRNCALARRFAAGLSADSRVEVLNEVVLNQVLVRFLAPDGDHDGYTRQVLAAVQRDGTCWMTGTTWQGQGGDADLGLQLVNRGGRH